MRWRASVIKVGVVGVLVRICVSRCLKEELALATDKLCLISNLKQSYTQELKNKAVLNLKQYCMHCYVVLSNVF